MDSRLLALVPWWAVTARNTRVLVRRTGIAIGGIVDGLLFFVVVGVGLGGIVSYVEVPGGDRVDYLAFVGPALVVSAAVVGAVAEAGNSVFARSRYEHVYRLVALTPLEPTSVMAGETMSAILRALWYAGGTLVVITVALGLDALQVAGIIAACVLVALPMAWLAMAVAARMRSWQQLAWFEMLVFPMTLFSATLFPADVVPVSLRWLVYMSPIFHGVSLARAATGVVPTSGWALVGHGVLLAILGVVAWKLAQSWIPRLLDPHT